MRFNYVLLFSVFALTALVGCRKDNLFTDSTTLEFTKFGEPLDTLTFDTVFTTQGSAVRSFVVHNNENQRINIQSLRIAGGESSPFRLNVDGVPGKIFENIEINAKDSIYVFVAVTIDPDASTNPFVIEDQVIFNVNGNTQSVTLNAWGQNAYFHFGETWPVDSVASWPNDKPHVIINSFLVDSNSKLTIQQGTRVYMHGNSAFFVYGTLEANGTKHDSIVFQGDRLEAYFKDLPGNWGYMRFLRSSHDNVLTHTVVKDALYGVIVDSLSENANPKVKLVKCTIKNMFNSGIRAASGSVAAENCLVYNCGDYCAELFYGGDYNFKHCTFANYGSVALSHQKPSVLLTNYYEFNFSYFVFPITNASFTNCIIYGGLDDELAVDSIKTPDIVSFNTLFQNCLIRSTENLEADINYPNVIRNQDPQFVTANPGENEAYNHHLNSDSPAIDTGFTAAGVTEDLEDKPRDFAPDIGCYEF